MSDSSFIHNGIKIELKGKICILPPHHLLDCNDYAEFTREFLTLSCDISKSQNNTIDKSTKFEFLFKNVDLIYESYEGKLFKIK